MATSGANDAACNLVQAGTFELKEAEHDPEYTGLLVFSQDTIIIVDFKARKVRLHSIQDGRLLAVYSTESKPCDICVFNEDESQVAVCLASGRIEILSVKFTSQTAEITRIATLNMRKGFDGCLGVKYFNKKLVVSGFKEDSLCWGIVSITDRHIETIHKICKYVGKFGSDLCTNNKDMIFISCCASDGNPDNGVYGYRNSTREFHYQHKNLNFPFGVTMDKRHVYVCNVTPPCIHEMTESGQPLTIHTEGIQPSLRLYAIHWNQQDGLLYITSYNSNVITRFRPEYSDHQDPIIPAEVLKMDTRSLDMYKEALRGGKEKVYNIRVMIVGQYGVGKTTLTKRLLGKDVNIYERKSTEGIDVHIECSNVSLASGEWTAQEKNLEQEYRLQRLAMVLIDKQQVMSPSQGGRTPEINTNVADKQQIKMDPVRDVSTSDSEANVAYDVEGDMTPNSNAYVADKDPMKEMIKLLQENADKLKRETSRTSPLSVWDFAGQFAFYTTHQTFLTRRAIYLLVSDVSGQVTDLVDDECYFDSEGITKRRVHELNDVWLNSIHSCSPSTEARVPPVILVGTHCDKIKQAIRHEICERYFRDIRTYLSDKPTKFHLVNEDFAIDNTIVDSRLEDLKRKIVEVASQQSYWGEDIPTRWLLLEQELMRLKAAGVKVITRSLLEDLNKAGAVPIATEELDLFLRFEHDIGTILYFSIEVLKDKIVLDPQWMIDALKSLITAEMFVLRSAPAVSDKWLEFKKSGKLSPKLIDAIWTKEHNPSLHDNKEHILLLMEHLNIIAKPRCYNEDESKIKVENYFLAPCMLKETTPREVISPEPQLDMESSSVLCYIFIEKFLPPPIFHRLIASCLSHWPIARKKSENLIFCGCCVFDIDRFHRLIVFFRGYIIFARVTRIAITEKTPSSKVCTAVREFLTRTLSNVTGCLGQSLQFELYIQCPESEVDSVDCLIPVADFQENVEVPCHFHEKSHVIRSHDVLKFWFLDERKMDLNEKACSRASDLTSLEESQTSLPRRALPPGKKYHAFFSFSSSDLLWVKKTVKELEKDGFVCCEYDRDNTPGTPLLTFVDNSIRNAYKTVIVMTREAFQSSFVLHEIQMALHQGFNERRKCVVPVLLEDCQVPRCLSIMNYIDARDSKRRDTWWPRLLMELEPQGE